MKRLRTCIAITRQPGKSEASAGSRAWRPLALTWRRHAVKPQAAAPARSRAAMHRHFHTQLHLTWNSWLTAAPLPPLPARAPITADPKRQHTLSRIELVRHLRHRVESRQELLRLRTLSDTRREFITRTSQTTSILAAPTPRASLMNALPLRESQARASPAMATPRDRAGHSEPAARSTAPLVHRARARAVIDERAVPHSRAPEQGPAPLVWIKLAMADPAAINPQNSPQPAAPAVTALASAPATRLAPGTPAMQAQTAREAVRSGLMDASVVDRLAEDVLKRVEKRLRIERERRGL